MELDRGTDYPRPVMDAPMGSVLWGDGGAQSAPQFNRGAGISAPTTWAVRPTKGEMPAPRHSPSGGTLCPHGPARTIPISAAAGPDRPPNTEARPPPHGGRYRTTERRVASGELSCRQRQSTSASSRPFDLAGTTGSVERSDRDQRHAEATPGPSHRRRQRPSGERRRRTGRGR